ncbi:MAG: tRNA glutamyl-Q(34) synthetase GluQRS [Hyphomonadaceae bacterium]|nr:tRNA glutamyl-Q(34) synthetase GluQRS [Hyphomonadaceae bacterium]
MNALRTRFAPSPTGPLHLGHVLSAALVRHAANEAGGEALLRIEDTDITRCRPEHEAAILDDLAWLGLTWDGVLRRQSEHFDDYLSVVAALGERGLVYRCFLTRQEMQERFPDGVVRSKALSKSEEAARLGEGAPFAWRLSLDAARREIGSLLFHGLSFQTEEAGRSINHTAEPERHGDIALTRKDAPAAYHLAACHDDALQEISHVIRGEDLVDAPHIHTLLQALMDWPRPIYRHHRLLLGEDGQKLSKRTGAKSLAALRSEGLSPDEVFSLAGLS